MTRIFSLFPFLTLGAFLAATPLANAADADSLAFFETKIRPVLAEKCYRCHSADAEKLKAGLQVDHIDHLLKGGETGPAIVAGKPEESFLIETIRYGDPDFQMPPKGKLDDAVIADFEKWVAMGAPWPDEPAPIRAEGGIKVDGSDVVMEAFDLEKRRSEHWAWRPITRPKLPAVKKADWATSEIDRFILAKLEAADLMPAEQAAPETWLRRVYFDLIGLPPTPPQIDAFLAKKQANTDSLKAEKAVVDQLLASPHFGERWARHWMDLARFGETCGHEFDYPIPYAWHYRDYLIDAFNDDLPYNQFLVEHLAGDLIERPRLDPENGTDASIVATGFWFLHEAVHAPTDIRGDEAGRIDNQIDVFSKSFLGLTVACARCHDHKFDAISAADYYSMAGYLQSSRRQEAFLDPSHQIADAVAEAQKIHQAGQNELPNAFGSAVGAAERFAKYLLAAEKVMEESSSDKNSGTSPGVTVFADFENGYGDWKVEGRAFGKKPATGAFAPNQSLSGFLGNGLVNTWIKSDKLTGRAVSPEFTIQQPYLHFLIAGGSNPDQTSVRLMIDGKAVEIAAGDNTDALKPHTWSVEKYRGKVAHIEIIDQATGGWGHIDADHFVFSDADTFPAESLAPTIDPALLTRVATQQGSLDESTLLNWVNLLRSEALNDAQHPLGAWKGHAEDPKLRQGLIQRDRNEIQEFLKSRKAATDLAVFAPGDPKKGWTKTGFSFDLIPRFMPTWAPGIGGDLVEPAGIVSTARVAQKFDGVLRSPTFELTHDHIHLRMKAKKATVRLVIDGHYMNRFHTLLLRGSILKNIDTEGRYQWLTMTGNLDKYVGHRVWLEISDTDDGYAALDEIVLSNEGIPKEPTGINLAVLTEVEGDSRDALAKGYGRHFANCLSALQLGEIDSAQADWLNFVWRNDLWPKSPAIMAQTKALKAVDAPDPIMVTAILDGTPEDERIHIRGSHQKLGDVVPRRNLTAFGGQAAPAQSSGRLELARQLVADDNPLVRRVIVNRVWHQLFGRGIVPTVDDFGKMGQSPSHPELLDWLAADFSEKQGWSIKQLLSEIVLSQTYRMSSAPHPDIDADRLAVVDPENILLHCAPVRRLQAEAIRDAVLTVSGRLDPSVGGASIPVNLTSFMEGRGRPGTSGPLDGAGRRSLYTEIRRNFLPPFLLAFDMPIPFNAMGRRSVSNVPAQALTMMNDPFIVEQAQLWADHITADASRTNAEKITDLFRSAFARRPSDFELGQIETFLASEPEPKQAWADLCHALLNKKEFIYLN